MSVIVITPTKEHHSKHLPKLYCPCINTQQCQSAQRQCEANDVSKEKNYNVIQFYLSCTIQSELWVMCTGHLTHDTVDWWDTLPARCYQSKSNIASFPCTCFPFFCLTSSLFLFSIVPSHLWFTNRKFGEECSIERGSMSSIKFTASQ